MRRALAGGAGGGGRRAAAAGSHGALPAVPSGASLKEEGKVPPMPPVGRTIKKGSFLKTYKA